MENYWIRRLPHNPRMDGLARRVPDVVFSAAAGTELKMQILRPWEGAVYESARRFPLIVFLQGSAWTFPDVDFELPQLAMLARDGYVVATITHRSYLDGHPAPAFLEDAKTAVRFLRAHAADYSIDPERVCFFGTSSGGNTALLVALTGDDPRYRTAEYADYSDAVQLAVECFGPSDLMPLLANAQDAGTLRKMLGGDPAERMDLIESISPIRVFDPAKEIPPILLLHGDADPLVPYEQTVAMYEKLRAAGKEAEMICVDGAPHEGSFWSRALWGEIADFIARRL